VAAIDCHARDFVVGRTLIHVAGGSRHAVKYLSWSQPVQPSRRHLVEMLLICKGRFEHYALSAGKRRGEWLRLRSEAVVASRAPCLPRFGVRAGGWSIHPYRLCIFEAHAHNISRLGSTAMHANRLADYRLF